MQCGANSACNPATATCDCSPGYEKNSAGACVDIDECLNASFCTGGKTCTNAPGSATCACPEPTWSGNLWTMDSGFEGMPNSLLTVWRTTDYGSGKRTYQAGPGRTGKSGQIQFSGGGTSPGEFGQKMNLNPSVNYIFSVWVRTSKLATSNADSIEGIFASDTSGAAFEAYANTVFGQWTQLTLPFTGIGSDASLRFGSQPDGIDGMWVDFDDVTLVQQTSPVCQ